jgi:ATP-dependent Clp protease adapter protein ClpS
MGAYSIISIFFAVLYVSVNAYAPAARVMVGSHFTLAPKIFAAPLQTSRRRGNSLLMAARSGGGGSTKLDTRIKQDTSTKSTLRDEIEKDWRLILHDDTVHTIQQVCEILGACCPLCAGPRAYEVTLEVHMTGAGTVAVANKKIIEEYCKSLQQAGLSVSMAPDDDFEGDEGVE